MGQNDETCNDKNRFQFYSLSLGEDLWEKRSSSSAGVGSEAERENYIWPDSHRELTDKIDEIRKKKQTRLPAQVGNNGELYKIS